MVLMDKTAPWFKNRGELSEWGWEEYEFLLLEVQLMDLTRYRTVFCFGKKEKIFGKSVLKLVKSPRLACKVRII